MLDISLPTDQQGSQDAVNDPTSLLLPFLSQMSLARGEGGGRGVFQ